MIRTVSRMIRGRSAIKMKPLERVRTERSEQERCVGARAHNLLTQRYKAEHRLRLGYFSPVISSPHSSLSLSDLSQISERTRL